MANVDRELAKMLYPKAADVVAEGLGSKVQTAYVYGTALTDSEDGTVTVSVEGDAMGVDAGLEVPTSNAIQEGDRVLVSINGNVPVEAVSAGSGDATRAIASEALEVAEATGQYFWHDDAGAHVSTEALNPTGPSNSLWNSLGLLIRKAANYLVSITQSAIAFYDGNGNASSNIVAQFGASGSQIGKASGVHIVQSSNALKFNDGAAEHMSLDMETPNGIDGMSLSTDLYGTYFGFEDESGYLSIDHNLTTLATRVEIKGQDDTGGSGFIGIDAGVPNVSGSDFLINTSNAYYQFTGAGNIRTNDAGGNATAYFVKYDASNDNRVQLEHRGCCIWQNGSRNVHIANGTTDSNSTWEYSFEAGGLYRRTKSGSTWSSWTKLA